ncbi:protein YlxR [Porphyridium purpureum]|uniref:Protein YlxR n=1 Tax=Porphyridium purpureum TaxID=35688 RepID=A0A5J4YW16_PORPP|nr:protein YlxR [Porphyridium purpureum]|eukprot:POR4333..scf209_3
MNHVERRQHKFQGRGPRQGRDMRLCIVTRERVNRFDLWRVVRIATGARAPDEPAAIIAIEQGNGRSVYIKRDVELIRKAQKRNVFSKALRVNVDSSVYDELVRLTELWSARQPNGTSQ